MLFFEGCLTLVCLQFLIFATGFSHVEGKKGFGETSQEWGYVTVRPGAKMFWWLYYTTSKDVTDPHDKPLLIWLQGGPGWSSTGHGNFLDIGPLDLDLKPRTFTWVNDYNVLFIDNPVGAGFSYAESYSAFAKNNTQIAFDLLECMREFYHGAPKWSRVPVYITSEAYGGKMAAEFALLWTQEQKAQRIKSNLRGLMMINSWISPVDSVQSWGPFLLQTGIVDTNGYERIKTATNKVKLAVENGQWQEATSFCTQAQNVVMTVGKKFNLYNILYETNWNDGRMATGEVEFTSRASKSTPDDRDERFKNLMRSQVKTALNIEQEWSSESDLVYFSLHNDFMKPVIDKVERLLNETNIEVFVVSGHLDLLVATPGTVAWVENLKWKMSTEWHKAPRRPLIVNRYVEGYVKQYENFKMYWIIRAGQAVARDNPVAMSAVLKSLTANAKWKD